MTAVWGIISGCTGTVHSFAGLAVCRCFLGFAEVRLILFDRRRCAGLTTRPGCFLPWRYLPTFHFLREEEDGFTDCHFVFWLADRGE